MATPDHTVTLDRAAYKLLETEARRRQVAPDELAGELVRERLGNGGDPPERMRAALAAAAEVRSKVRGPVDAVALVREGERVEDPRGGGRPRGAG